MKTLEVPLTDQQALLVSSLDADKFDDLIRRMQKAAAVSITLVSNEKAPSDEELKAAWKRIESKLEKNGRPADRIGPLQAIAIENERMNPPMAQNKINELADKIREERDARRR